MKGAVALLAPSFIEGTGMPIAEALGLGTPVIASDIPSHREIAGAFADFIDPLDGPAWLGAITARLRENRSASRTRSRYLPFSWPDHFEALESIIARFGAGNP